MKAIKKGKQKKGHDKLTTSGLWSTPIVWNLEQKKTRTKKDKVNNTLPIKVVSKANAVKYFSVYKLYLIRI